MTSERWLFLNHLVDLKQQDGVGKCLLYFVSQLDVLHQHRRDWALASAFERGDRDIEGLHCIRVASGARLSCCLSLDW